MFRDVDDEIKSCDDGHAPQGLQSICVRGSFHILGMLHWCRNDFAPLHFSSFVNDLRANREFTSSVNTSEMDDQYLNMLQYAAAVPAPIRLQLNRASGESDTFDFAKPFVTIGRHPDNDIVIENRGISSKHLYLQAIGSRIAAIDLFSTSGTEWLGADFHGWLTHQHTIKIPGAELKLADNFWLATPPLKSPLEFRPREEQREEYGILPKVELELLNTSSKGKKWPINRVITLIGRDDRCRITILDKSISRVHCALLLLPSGLWAIDLTRDHSVVINGQSAACMMIAEGTVLQLGPYQLTARYPDLAASLQKASELLESGECEFLTQHNRIFKTKIFGDTIVVLPQGDSQEFFYQDIHVEANRVLDVIHRRKFKHVIIDFSQSQTVGHILVEALSSFCRSSTGKSALCACTVATYEMLQTTKLFNIWPHYQTRQDAMQAVALSE